MNWEENLKSLLKTNHENGCLEFQGKIYKNGYGSFRAPGGINHAHRAAWVMYNGHPPFGYMVCHSCDNRKCCRDEHLFLGKSKDNSEDMVRKDRQARGERVGSAKLTSEAVSLMRNLMASGKTPAEVGAVFGVSRRQASNIRSWKQWRNHEILMGAK